MNSMITSNSWYSQVGQTRDITNMSHKLSIKQERRSMDDIEQVWCIEHVVKQEVDVYPVALKLPDMDMRDIKTEPETITPDLQMGQQTEKRLNAVEERILETSLPHLHNERVVKQEVDIGPVILQLPDPARRDMKTELETTTQDLFHGQQNEKQLNVLEEGVLETVSTRFYVKQGNCKKKSTETFEHIHSVIGHRTDRGLEQFNPDNESLQAEDILCYSGEKPFKCCECGESFYRKDYLASHTRCHTDEKPFKCSECGKCFTQKRNLITHSRCHTDEKPFKCSECGECFYRKDYLVAHILCHTGEKPFKCTECGKCFSHKHNLVDHTRCHTGEKPFKCSECGKCFSQKQNLAAHTYCHTGEKPFKCSECGKTFSALSSLSRHGRIHTVGKSFKCSACGQCFSILGKLRKHARCHTGKKPFK